MQSDTIVPATARDAAAVIRRRRDFMRRSAFTLAGVTGAMAFAPQALAKKVGNTDRANLTAIQKHENDHVAFLVSALGASARPKPTFQKLQQDTLRHFFATAQVLENVGVGAYLGAAPAIDDSDNLAAAGSIALIEARHAGWLNERLSDPITGTIMDLESDNSFEDPLTAAEVTALAGVFIASLNGGPAVTYSTTPSPSNDVAILNFALALEYLEAEFYNVNIAKFFG